MMNNFPNLGTDTSRFTITLNGQLLVRGPKYLQTLNPKPQTPKP